MVKLNTEYIDELTKETHPGIDIGGAGVGMYHGNRFAAGGRDHINFRIELGERFFKHNHGKDGGPCRDITRSGCHAVGSDHPGPGITFGWAQWDTSLQLTAGVKQPGVFFVQSACSLASNEHFGKNLIECPGKIF